MKNRPDITPACWANKPTGTTDVMGRLWWDRPSATIRTEFFKPEKATSTLEDRVISHREGARSDWYLFEIQDRVRDRLTVPSAAIARPFADSD